MRVTGINANFPVTDIAAARDFYTDYLGLSIEEFNLGIEASDGEVRALAPGTVLTPESLATERTRAELDEGRSTRNKRVSREELQWLFDTDLLRNC